MWTQYTLYQYTNKVVCVRDYYVQNNPPLTLVMSLTKKANPAVLFLSNTELYIILWSLQSGSSYSGILKKLCIPSFFTIYKLHATYVLSSFLWLR